MVLRSFGILGLGITLIWALSPLGGQALLRILKIEPFYSRYDKTVMYLDPHFLNSTWLEATSGSAEVFSYMTTLYLSSLVAPLAVQNSPRDLWNNPKIPSPKSLNGSIYQHENSWFSVVETPTTQYMNLIGIPIGNLTNLSTSVSSHMIVESLQMDVRCTASNITTPNAVVDDIVPMMYTGFRSAPVNGSFQRFWNYQAQGIATSFLYVSNTSFLNNSGYLRDISGPLTIYYGSTTAQALNGSSSGLGISLTTCSMTPLSLESNVSCSGNFCAINAMRKVPTKMNWDQQRTLSFALANGAFCGMGLAYHTVQSSQTELFLADPGSVIGGESQYDWVKLWSLPLDILEDRFALAFNAFYYTAGAQLFSSGFNGREPAYESYTNISASMTERLGEHYVCSKVWFTSALIISILLEIMAVVSAVLRFLTQVPDIFGYVSSLIINNVYCNQNGMAKSTALSGLARARSMRRTKFRLMDVRSHAEVGYIAFVPLLGDTKASEHHSNRIKANGFYD